MNTWESYFRITLVDIKTVNSRVGVLVTLGRSITHISSLRVTREVNSSAQSPRNLLGSPDCSQRCFFISTTEQMIFSVWKEENEYPRSSGALDPMNRLAHHLCLQPRDLSMYGQRDQRSYYNVYAAMSVHLIPKE